MNGETCKVPITCLRQSWIWSKKQVSISFHQKVLKTINQQSIPTNLVSLGWPALPARFSKPDDGLPMLEDWLGCFESMLLGGIDLQREPLDGAMNPHGG